jgi:hypothetical protein
MRGFRAKSGVPSKISFVERKTGLDSAFSPGDFVSLSHLWHPIRSSMRVFLATWLAEESLAIARTVLTKFAGGREEGVPVVPIRFDNFDG